MGGQSFPVVGEVWVRRRRAPARRRQVGWGLTNSCRFPAVIRTYVRIEWVFGDGPRSWGRSGADQRGAGMTTGHLVQECGEAIAAALDKADAVELLYLSPAEKAAAMREFARLAARVDATRLRLMAVADEVTEERGDRDVAAWCQRELLVDRGAARRDMTLAGALEHRWTRAGPGAPGGWGVDRAGRRDRPGVGRPPRRDPAPTWSPPRSGCWWSTRRRSRRRSSVSWAAGSSTSSPRRWVRSRSASKLEGEERKARRTTSLTTRSHGDGSTTIRIRVPDATADRLLTYLHAWTNPRKHDGKAGGGTDAGAKVSYPTRLGSRVLRPVGAPRPHQAPPSTAGPPRPWSSRWTTTP